MFFFFQAEDGIRDGHVTGVQTCALPIWLPSPAAAALVAGFVWLAVDNKITTNQAALAWVAFGLTIYAGVTMVSNAPFYSGKNFALGRSVDRKSTRLNSSHVAISYAVFFL